MKWSTTSMEFFFDEESGILTITPPEGFSGPETMEHAQENLKQAGLMGDELKGILAYLPNHYVNVKITRFYRQNAPNIPVALLLEGESFFKKMMGNFFLSLDSGVRPTRIFTSEGEALEWLKEKMAKVEIK